MATLEEKRTEILNMIHQYNSACELLGGDKIILASTEETAQPEVTENEPRIRVLKLTNDFFRFNEGMAQIPECFSPEYKHRCFEGWLTERGFHQIPGTSIYTDDYNVIAKIAFATIEFYKSESEYRLVNTVK